MAAAQKKNTINEGGKKGTPQTQLNVGAKKGTMTALSDQEGSPAKYTGANAGGVGSMDVEPTQSGGDVEGSPAKYVGDTSSSIGNLDTATAKNGAPIEGHDASAGQIDPWANAGQVQQGNGSGEKPYGKPELRGAEELAAKWGNITYDEDKIRGKFDDASRAEYATKNQEYQNTENNFLKQTYAGQGLSLDTIRKANAAAVATGASRGMQAANELSTVLGAQQSATEGATQLAQQRNLLKQQEAEAYTKNASDALKYANETKFNLGNLDTQLYGYDTQYDVGEMNYYAQLDAAQKQLQGTMYNADQNYNGNVYTSNNNLAGTKYTADQNLAGTMYNADANLQSGLAYADAYKEAAQYTANGNYLAAQVAAAGNKEAAKIAADAQKEIASKSNITQQQQIEIGDALNKYAKNGNQAAFTAVLAQVGVSQETIDKLWKSMTTPTNTTKKDNKTKVTPAPQPQTPQAGSTWIKNADGSYTNVQTGVTVDQNGKEIPLSAGENQ